MGKKPYFRRKNENLKKIEQRKIEEKIKLEKKIGCWKKNRIKKIPLNLGHTHYPMDVK